jgi:hypothetical protein
MSFSTDEEKLNAYKDWVRSRGYKETREILDMNIIEESTGYYKVLGQEEVDLDAEHIAGLDQYLAEVKENGLTLDIFSM